MGRALRFLSSSWRTCWPEEQRHSPATSWWLSHAEYLPWVWRAESARSWAVRMDQGQRWKCFFFFSTCLSHRSLPYWPCLILNLVVIVRVSDPDGESVRRLDAPTVLYHWSSAEEATARPAPQLSHSHHRRRSTYLQLWMHFFSFSSFFFFSFSILNSILSGPWAQCPVRLPANHPKGCCDEEIWSAADPHECHGGLWQVLQLLQPLPSDQHSWQDFPSGGKTSFTSLFSFSVQPWTPGV